MRDVLFNDCLIGNFAVSVLILLAMFGLSEFLCHISCVIARVTKKKVCRCWDCPKKCELYENSVEPDVVLQPDEQEGYYCPSCNTIIAACHEPAHAILYHHRYCGHCGKLIYWGKIHPFKFGVIDEFGSGKTIGLFNKFRKKVK